MPLKKLFFSCLLTVLAPYASLSCMDTLDIRTPIGFLQQLAQYPDWHTTIEKGLELLERYDSQQVLYIIQYLITNEEDVAYGKLWTQALLNSLSENGHNAKTLFESLQLLYKNALFKLSQTAIDLLIQYSVNINPYSGEPMIKELYALEGLQFLYTKGEKLSINNITHLTATNKLRLVEWLLQRGHVNPNTILSKHKQPILHVANTLDMVILFIRYGNTQINSKDHDGDTFLHKLTRHFVTKPYLREWITYLKNQGAQLHKRNKDGKAPLDLAIKNKNTNAIEVLTELGTQASA